jgi:hypothetical protein
VPGVETLRFAPSFSNSGGSLRSTPGTRGPREFAVEICEIVFVMRQRIGYYLQLAVLIFLPLLILWQLEYGFRLIIMPALTLVGIIVFWIGYKLREGGR